MAVAIVQTSGPIPVVVRLQADSAADTTVPTSATTVVAAPKDPSPLSIVPAELYWAGGCFIVLLILMRLVLSPRVAKGMEERAGYIKTNHEQAARDREAALI